MGTLRIRQVIFLCAFAASGCVSTAKYESATRSVELLRAELARAEARHEAARTELDARVATLQRSLDEATAENGGLRAELERLGTNVDALLSDKGILASALEESRERLGELRRAEAAAERRALLYRDLATRLKEMLDSGALAITLREGRMVLQLPNDVLFDSGRIEIKPAGRAALRAVAAVLKALEGRRFHVGGHTDDMPIATTRFPSNWELSMARGLEVLRLLVAEGVAPNALAAEGYGEFDPVASNDDAKGRARNRRTEIALQPRVDELVTVPDAPLPAATSPALSAR